MNHELELTEIQRASADCSFSNLTALSWRMFSVLYIETVCRRSPVSEQCRGAMAALLGKDKVSRQVVEQGGIHETENPSKVLTLLELKLAPGD